MPGSGQGAALGPSMLTEVLQGNLHLWEAFRGQTLYCAANIPLEGIHGGQDVALGQQAQQVGNQEVGCLVSSHPLAIARIYESGCCIQSQGLQASSVGNLHETVKVIVGFFSAQDQSCQQHCSVHDHCTAGEVCQACSAESQDRGARLMCAGMQAVLNPLNSLVTDMELLLLLSL